MDHFISSLNKIGSLLKTILLNLGGWLTVISMVSVFIVYRTIIDLILRIKIGKKYGGIVSKTDSFMCLPDISKCCITTVLYIRSEKEVDLLPSIKKIFKQRVLDNPNWYPKLTSGKHEFGGYPYWIKNECQIDDVILPLALPEDTELTEESLKVFTAKISNSEHVKNSIMWDVHVSQTYLKDQQDNSFLYPMVARFHHVIADGTSLVSLLIRVFGDDNSQNYGKELFKRLFKQQSIPNGKKEVCKTLLFYLIKWFKSLALAADLIFLAFGRLTQENQLRPTDVNALHGHNYLGNKIVAWTTEDTVECLPLVKKIKNRANSKFTCVLGTAVTASLTNYLKRNNLPIPNRLTGGLTQLLKFPSLDPSKPVPLENKTTVFIIELPCTDKYPNLAIALENTTQIMMEHIRIADAMMNLFLMENIIGWLPPAIGARGIGFQSETFVITNVPGGSKIKLFDGCVLEKIIPIAPNIRGVGVSIAILSYDDRLQVGLLVDKSLITSQEEAQKITDDILENIRKLDVECGKVYGV